MSEFPECLEPRAAYADNSGQMYGMNGQRCHRIAGHRDYSNCIFDRPAEFDPPVKPTNFRTENTTVRMIPKA